MSNVDTLKGYYNIYDKPIYINSDNYNYNLNNKSPGIRLGNNNLNIGANLYNNNNIKYLNNN